jgi:hypothetical protein
VGAALAAIADHGDALAADDGQVAVAVVEDGSGFGRVWVMTGLLTPSDVLDFWKEAGPKLWYAKDAAFDDRFRAAFAEGHMAAARRELDGWMETPDGALALMILLDQYPRNSFRGTGHQFATDGLALAFATGGGARVSGSVRAGPAAVLPDAL